MSENNNLIIENCDNDIPENLTQDDLQLILKRKNDSLYTIQLLNNSNHTIEVKKQDSKLYLIQEALNSKGLWKPIEYWEYSSCGTSYKSEKLLPESRICATSTAYTGNFNTKIRFKLLNNNLVYFSNIIDGQINKSQFQLSDLATGDSRFQIALAVGDSALAKKLIFLEPNALIEFAENHDEYLTKLIEKNKN